MTKQHFPILDQMTVKPATNGLVAVTVPLPPDLIRDYCRFSNLSPTFFTPSTQGTLELAILRASTQSAFHADAQCRLAEYRARLIIDFDAYTDRGLACGQPMILRTARKGANAGAQFWGCSAYPDCKTTQPIKPIP